MPARYVVYRGEVSLMCAFVAKNTVASWQARYATPVEIASCTQSEAPNEDR